jgi:hypothetical protein
VCKNSKIYATKYFFIVNKNKKSAKRGADGNSICKNIAKFAMKKRYKGEKMGEKGRKGTIVPPLPPHKNPAL